MENNYMDTTTALTDLSVKMLQSVADQPNVLISPISAIAALTMAQHGAAGNTRTQMNAVLGADADKLDQLLAELFPADHECTAGTELANGVWIRNSDDIRIHESYLEKLRQNPCTEFLAVGADENPAAVINEWVSRKTDGKLGNIVGEIPDTVMMCLLNALAFSAGWETEYKTGLTHDRIFTAENGIQTKIPFMNSQEDLLYIHDVEDPIGARAIGYIKPYEGGRYAFAALLPEKGISLKDYIHSLSGERLQAKISDCWEEEVVTAVPKFTQRFETDLRTVFEQLGITDAFDAERADFSAAGICTDSEKNLCIDSILQRTYLDLNEKGTEAYAVTEEYFHAAIGAISLFSPPKVYLDRPFLYMIMDRQMNLPLFMGTVTDIEQMKGN